jgi:hypothetical protein
VKIGLSLDRPGTDARPYGEGASTALAKMLSLRDLKPSQLAKLALCSPSTLSRAIRGEKPLGNRLRGTIARVLDCDERDLIDSSPSHAVREIIGVLGAAGSGFRLPARFDAANLDSDETEQLAMAALQLIRAKEPAMAIRVVERLLAKLAPEPVAASISGHKGRLIEWHDRLSSENLGAAQRLFLERAQSCGGDLTDHVLEPLVEDGCFARTSIYDATPDLNIRHLASGVNHVTAAQRLQLQGQPATNLCAPPSLVTAVVSDLGQVRDHGGFTIRHVVAELGAETYSWHAATVRIGPLIVAACKLIESQ